MPSFASPQPATLSPARWTNAHVRGNQSAAGEAVDGNRRFVCPAGRITIALTPLRLINNDSGRTCREHEAVEYPSVRSGDHCAAWIAAAGGWRRLPVGRERSSTAPDDCIDFEAGEKVTGYLYDAAAQGITIFGRKWRSQRFPRRLCCPGPMSRKPRSSSGSCFAKRGAFVRPHDRHFPRTKHDAA